MPVEKLPKPLLVFRAGSRKRAPVVRAGNEPELLGPASRGEQPAAVVGRDEPVTLAGDDKDRRRRDAPDHLERGNVRNPRLKKEFVSQNGKRNKGKGRQPVEAGNRVVRLVAQAREGAVRGNSGEGPRFRRREDGGGPAHGKAVDPDAFPVNRGP